MKIINLSIRFAILAVVLTCSTTVFADVKIKSKQTSAGQSTENTTYIKGKRQRTEMAGGAMVTVTQCDLQRDLQINPQAKTYMINAYDNGGSSTPGATTVSQTVKSTKGGIVTTTVTNKDTGERKQMFGYTARHIIQTIETVSSPDACSPANSKMEIDAWYIDATFALDCDLNKRYRAYANKNGGGCQDTFNMKTVGSAKTGYPVYQKMTMFDEAGKPSFTTIQEVLEISNATLDAALFDVPTDYREVKNASEMYSASAMQTVASSSSSGGLGSQSYGQNPSDSGMAKNVQALSQSSSAAPSANAGDKKPGVVRLGLANVKTGAVGEGLSAQDLAAAIKNSLAEYLKTPKIELVTLDAKLPSAIADEAKEKQCDFVIYANVSHKKGGGGGGFGGMFGKVLSSGISQVGGLGGATGSVMGNIATQVATQAISSAAMGSNMKSKDEITLDIKLVAADDSAALTRQYKAKAKSNGDDIISPLIEQAAQEILDAVKK